MAGLLSLAVSAGAKASVSSGPGLKIVSAKTVKSGKGVRVKVRWHRGMRGAAGDNKRFVLRVLAHRSKNRRLLRLRTLQRTEVGKGRTEVILVRTNPRRLKRSKRVTVTATQKYDSPTDGDRFFERGAVSVRPVAGKARGLGLRSCTKAMVVPNADLSDCDLAGAQLSNMDLSGVSFRRASLQQGTLSGSNLRTTDLTSTNLIAADLRGALWPDAEQSALTFPEEGEDIVGLIGTAQESVDIVIYDFGGPNLVGQPSNPGALMKAVQRGVNVRVILNSSQRCKGTDTDKQKECAGQTSLDPLYATQAALSWAAQNPLDGHTPGKFRVQFSSENYQVTHQKSILIDTANSDGSPRSAAQMTSSSKILVSTGNLQAFPVDWGLSEICKKYVKQPDGSYVCTASVQNSDFLTNPAGLCTGGTPAGCATEWAPRDFAIEVTNHALMERIAAVYAADQACKTWDEAPIYQQLLGSDLPDTWANGTLLADGSGYPTMGTSAFYGGDPDADPPQGPNPALQNQPQGNSRARQLSLMNSAQQSLIVYNEEMSDPDMANALVAASERGVNVRVVMASNIYKGVPSQNKYFDFLTANGVKVNLLPRSGAPGVDYIHAKAIVADGTNAFMGSENFGYASLNFNRELGLMLTNTRSPASEWLPSVQGVAAIRTAFESDWANPAAVPYERQAASPPYPYPALVPGTAFSGANLECLSPDPGDLYSPALPPRTPSN